MPEDNKTDQGTEGQSDKEKNFEALRQQLDAANERIANLEPKALREDVREAGFDPSSDKGKVLVKDLQRGDVKVEDGQELPDVLKAYAESEYNWKPPTTLTPTEQQQVTGSQRLASLQNESSSERPAADITSEYEAKIAEAREAGDFARASMLQSEYDARMARRAG